MSDRIGIWRSIPEDQLAGVSCQGPTHVFAVRGPGPCRCGLLTRVRAPDGGLMIQASEES